MSHYQSLEEKRECEMCGKKAMIWKCDLTGGIVYACKKCVKELLER